ncbi:MAG: LysR substrate-binding domain-containing protein, partial [Pseudomonadota bacterium]
GASHGTMEVRLVAIAGSLIVLRNLAITGAGVSVLPDYLCAEAIERGDLVVLAGVEGAPANRLFLVWRKGALRHPRVVFALDQVRDQLRQA